MANNNLAYDETIYSYGYIEAEQTPSHIRIRKGKKTKGKAKPEIERVAKRRLARKARLRNRVLTFTLIAAAFFVLCRGVVITEKCNAVEDKKKQLEEIVSKNQKMQIEIDSTLNLNNIEDIAANKLNMARPEKHQTVYISIPQEQVVEKTNGGIKTPKTVEKIINCLKAYLA